jgi:hypothetical protein
VIQLADLAAGLAQRDAAVHRLLAFTLDEVHHLLLQRREHLDRRARTGAGALQQRQGFRVQHARLQHEHRDLQLQGVDQVRDDDVFRAQAGRLLERREPAGGAHQQVLRGGELGGVVVRGTRVQVDGAHGQRRNSGCVPAASPW